MARQKACATRYHIRARKFLNRDPAYPAFVIGIVEDTRALPDPTDEKNVIYGEIELEFGDCYRRVSFDFSMHDRRARADSLYKIKHLAEVVNAVREAIEKEVQSLGARPQPPTKKSA